MLVNDGVAYDLRLFTPEELQEAYKIANQEEGAEWVPVSSELGLTSNPNIIYSKDHDQEQPCKECGHAYRRHWDWMEDNEYCRCKYCDCIEFVE